MPFNPSGVFVRLYRWVTDRDNDIRIDATRMDAETDGIVSGINSIVNQTRPFIGNIKAPVGTALTPAYSFANDTDTGLYRAGADEIGLAVGGTQMVGIDATGVTVNGTVLNTPARLEVGTATASPSALLDFHSNGSDTTTNYDTRITSTGGTAGTAGQGSLRFEALQVQHPNGTPAAPSVTFASDLDTGIYRSAADSVAIATGGVSRLVVNNGGASVTGSFTVPAGSQAVPGLQFGGATNGVYWTPGTGPRFVDNGEVIARIVGGTTLTTGDSVVTRQAGDARYLLESDANVVKTGGAQSITGAKTFTSMTTIAANSGGLRFIKDSTARTVADFFTSTNTLAFIQRLSASGDMEFQGEGGRQFRFFAPVSFGFGDGQIYFEDHASDGNGAGLCLRTAVDPSGNGMIFSVRSFGGSLGLGVQSSKISSARGEMYLGASDGGAGGNRVHHAGVGVGEVGTYAQLRVNGGVTAAPGQNIAASSFAGYANASGDDVSGSPIGTWKCMGFAGGSSNADRTATFLRIA